MPLILLPFLSSGFVPTESMPAGLRWFAEYQPFTPSSRPWALGRPWHQRPAPVAWFAIIGLVAYRWAMGLYNRDPVAPAPWAQPTRCQRWGRFRPTGGGPRREALDA